MLGIGAMRVLPPEQIYRPAAYASRAERRSRVVDVIECSTAPAARASVPTGLALVPVTHDASFRQLMSPRSRAAAGWLAHALGQMSAGQAAEPACAAAAYDRADAMADVAIRPELPGARLVV
jgi:hypothetical protein